MFKKQQLIQFIISLSVLFYATLSVAGGTESLRRFYHETHAMTAKFHQLVTDSKGRKVQEVDGEMQLKRPNQFRWDYHKPFEQQIVSDGKQVWLYDAELAQVTISAISKALGSSPAALLSGSDELDKSFTMVDMAQANGLEWVSVTPKSNETGFNLIELGFNQNHLLQEMKLVDGFGQHTDIVFSQQIQNPNIALNTFLFKVPKGVDVVGE